MSPLHIGIIGTGWGLTRAEKFRQIENCRVTLGWSRSAEKRAHFSRQTGAGSVETWEAVCESPEVDAVVVATPHVYHFEQARAALKAGKHVLVETPLALSYPEAHELARVAAASGVVLHHGAKWRYHPDHEQHLANMGRAGELVYAETTVCWSAGPENHWYHDFDLSRGAFALLPYTCVEFFELFGEPAVVDGKHVRRDGLDFATIWLVYPEGGCVRICRGTGKGLATSNYGMIVGTEGTVVWGKGPMQLLRGEEVVDLPSYGDADVVLCECSAFIGEIEGVRDFGSDLELDLKIIRAVDEAKHKAGISD